MIIIDILGLKFVTLFFYFMIVLLFFFLYLLPVGELTFFIIPFDFSKVGFSVSYMQIVLVIA